MAAHILAEVEDGLLPDGPAYLLADDLVVRIPVEMVVAHILAEVEDGPAYLLVDGPAYLLVDDLVARILVGMVAAHTLVALEGIRRVYGPAYLLPDGLVVRIPVAVVDSLLTSDVVCPQISHRDLLHERH